MTVIKNSRPIAQIIPIDKVEEEQDMVNLAKEFMDEYDDMFVELAK